MFPLMAFLPVLLGLASEGKPEQLKLVQTIPLPNVEGRIDHLAVDVKGKRLFVAALGNNTVEVIDLKGGKLAKSLTGFHEPQGIAFLPDANRVIVANGGGGVDVLDGGGYHVIHRRSELPDADNVRYDGAAKRVSGGYGDCALAVIEAANGKGIARSAR